VLKQTLSRTEERMRESFTLETGTRLRQGLRRGGVVIVLLAIGIMSASSVSCVRTGHVGVVTLFGRVTGRAMPEGIHLVNPLARVHELDVKTQEIKERASVPSKEGLIMGVEASVLYHLRPERAAEVFQTIGSNYSDVLLVPNFRSSMRAVTASNTASALYSDSRETIARQILAELRQQVQERGIVVENVLLRDLQLPETLKQAIEAKQQAQQEAQRMEFVLQKERQEAERKRVEAAGIKDFQDIVTQGISDKLLEWKGIEATMELSRSQNTKVVIVGNPKSGLPLIYAADK
jgi:regulator of protease activity HflC (stomatin/prohibitin superfamily)